MLSFRNRLLILLIGLVVGAQTVTLFTALASTKATVRKDAGAQLAHGARSARQQLESRGQLLTIAATAMARDYPFRQLVATGHSDTIATALDSLASRTGSKPADVALALDQDGGLMAQGKNTDDIEPELIAAIAASEALDSEGAQFLVAPTSVYQVVTAPVMAPDEIGRIALGFTVDDLLASELGEQVGGEVAFLAGAGDARRFVVGTSTVFAEAELASWSGLGDTPTVASIGGEQYLAIITHLATQGRPLDLVLLSPMRDVMAPYRELALVLGLIIGATIAAAVIAGVYLGGGAARPVQQLAAGAARIAEGDYSSPVDGSSGGRELANLAQAFNTMQRGIAERESRLLHMAQHDAATGLPNRIFAEQWLNQHLQELAPDQRIGMVLVAVTNLQEISASLGFDITGELVWHLARSLEHWSAGGLVARIDATHFMVATRAADGSDMNALVTQVREHSLAPLATGGITLQAAVVLGAVAASRTGGNATELLRCVEAAVETAIQLRQPYAFFEHASDEAQRRRMKLGADLPAALQSGQLYLQYQPKFRVNDRSPRGVETLLRWRHPEFGNVSPAEFIPIAERTGTSGLVTRWVLRNALAQLAEWHRQGIRVELAVNLSAADIVDPDMLEFILGALRDARLTASSLMLEITESVLLHEPAAARRNMELLRVAGVRFSIDDFGTGYSSLSQLRELPADELKIDMSFVRSITQGAEHQAVIRAIVDLGRGLGLRTVAEGVEEETQWHLLAELGCDYVQGYLTGRPMTAEELTPQLRAARDSAVHETQTASLRVLELRRKE